MRPIRLYQHRFSNGVQVLEIPRSGSTPCEAKGKAFAALEAEIRAHQYPPLGWRLLKQDDITYLLAQAQPSLHSRQR